MKKYTGFRQVNQLIEKVTKPSCQKFGFATQRIIANWHHIMGSQLSKFTAPGRIMFGPDKTTGGTLYIEVANPGFSLEIQAQESLIVSRIASYFGYQAVSRIKVVIVPSIAKSSSKITKKAVAKAKVSANDFAEIDESLADIADEELKQTLTSLANQLFEKKSG